MPTGPNGTSRRWRATPARPSFSTAVSSSFAAPTPRSRPAPSRSSRAMATSSPTRGEPETNGSSSRSTWATRRRPSRCRTGLARRVRCCRPRPTPPRRGPRRASPQRRHGARHAHCGLKKGPATLPALRLAMLAPISWRTPPRAYGPWELVTSLLTEALVARGVDVTLFATADSITAGKLAAVCPRPYSDDPSIDAKVWELLHVAHVFERAYEFDVIHNQADFVPLAFSRLVETPIVTTIHGFSSDRIVPAYRRYEDRVAYVAISAADRRADLRYAATIHHGIALD